MGKCERCGKEYFRQKSEIIMFPRVCKECDIILSNLNKESKKMWRCPNCSTKTDDDTCPECGFDFTPIGD